MPTRSDTLATWLGFLEGLHPRAIDLGLDRVRTVWQRLGNPRPAPICVLVGGTNGKGSTVAFLANMLTAAGHRVGTYTSPHLLHYNERVCCGGVAVDDASLIDAFARIDSARGEVSLSYFEFGTLAAFLVLAQADLEVAVLEIGLGGRLDAVNLIDADVAILTSVDLDHQEYLGATRERIGWDKAHIFRCGRPAIVAAVDAPASVFEVAAKIGAQVLSVPALVAPEDGHWACPLPDGSTLFLPLPRLVAPAQRRNATAAVWAWWLLRERLPFAVGACARGVATASVRGRLERLPRAVETWVDVAHNPEAARELAAWLRRLPARHTVAVFAALGDKDLNGIVTPLVDCFGSWIVVDLASATARAARADDQALALQRLLPIEVTVTPCVDLATALQQADRLVGPEGRIVVFGSFFTVAAALRAIPTAP